LLANLLGRYGLRVLVLEREAAAHAQPRAAHLDDEAFRILQAVGVAEAVQAASRPLDGLDVVTAEGRVLVRARKAGAKAEPYGYPAATLIHQPQVEAALRARVAQHPNVAVRLGHAVETVEADADGVTLRGTGPAGRFEVHAAWAVGCDGARSRVRAAMGSPLRGGGFEQPWLVVDVRLTRAVNLPDRLLQIADTQRPTTYVPFPDPRRRWEFMLQPGESEATMTQPATIRRLLSRWVDPDAVEVERAAVYTFHDLTAEGWRRGRLLLAGDAAHQMPPFLGQGLCAGARDAHALAWRLALVARGAADSGLLDGYEAERRPHVRAVTRLAVRAGRLLQLGTAAARFRDGAFALAHHLPPLRRRLLDLEGDIPRIPLAFAGTALPRRPLIPQPFVTTEAGETVRLDAVLGDGFALLGLGLSPRAWAGMQHLRVWTTLATRAVYVVPEGAPWPATAGGEVAVRDPSGALAAWAGCERGVIVVRPDRHAFGVYDDGEGRRAALAVREALGLRIG